MENINLKNGIHINKTKIYTMYHMYFPDTSEFFMCIPNDSFEKYKVIMDFADINFNSTDIDIDDKVNGIFSPKADKVYEEYPNSIYIIPKIPLSELNEIINENDDRLYKKLINQLQKCRNNAYWSLATAAIFEDSIKIEPEINIMKQGNEDKKLFWWLDINNIKGYKQVELHDKNKQEEPPKERTPVIIIDTHYTPPTPTDQKVKKRTPKGDGIHSTGYSNLGFMITILIISGMMGICLAYLILR